MSSTPSTVAIPISVVENSKGSVQDRGLPRLKDRITEELVIGLVGPVGSGCTTAGDLIADILQKDYSYLIKSYTLSSYISEYAHFVGEKSTKKIGAERIQDLQRIGDSLRQKFGSGYLAAKAVEKIAENRSKDGIKKSAESGEIPISIRHVHIIDSLKNPEELKLLRDTYGDMFWVFGVFAPKELREDRLKDIDVENKDLFQKIIERDYNETEKYGQSVRDVFHQADFFVRNDQKNTDTLRLSLSRYLEILFGYPVHTPSKDESAMYAAHAEAGKSACLSRQVGAAIVSNDGELIGLGRNDVPRFNGGLYDEDNHLNDHRCFKWGGRLCHNDKKKNLLYEQIAKKLIDYELISNANMKQKVIEALQETDVRSLIEYSRAVHAEMDAIVSVARKHKAGIVGGTLYATTFPCHACARHIVASGITRVLYIEPYPKSLAMELHEDAASENESHSDKKVVFLQYSGVAPKNMLTFFNARLTRKQQGGKIVPFDKRTARPLVAVSLDDYPTHEKLVIAEYAQHESTATRSEQAALFESGGASPSGS